MKIKLDYQNLFNYIIDTGICNSKELQHIEVDPSLSHNYNWVIKFLDTKKKIFIKQINCLSELELDNRIYCERRIYNFLESTKFFISHLIPNSHSYTF